MSQGLRNGVLSRHFVGGVGCVVHGIQVLRTHIELLWRFGKRLKNQVLVGFTGPQVVIDSSGHTLGLDRLELLAG